MHKQTHHVDGSASDIQGETVGRAADDLFRVLEAMINNGTLGIGDRLPPEREIVKTYGVSRTVVREAILALSNKGLVEARPRFRPVVKAPSYSSAMTSMGNIVARMLRQPGGVRNLFDTRILVESGLVREAAKSAGKGDIAALKTALTANGNAVGDSDLFYTTDIAFHRVLYDISDNPVIRSVHLAYATWLAPQWSQMPRQPDRNQINFRAHTAIFEAILMRDPDAAEAALRAHMADAWDQVRLTFGDI